MPFHGPGWSTLNDVTEGLIVTDSPEPAGLPLPKIVLHATLAGFSEEAPRLPARARHHRHVVELQMSIFRTVASTQCLNQANDFPPLLEADLHHGTVHDVGKKRVGRDEDVSTRHKHMQGLHSPTREEILQRALLCFAENCEARKWPTCTAVECGRHSPHPALSATKFCLLFRGVFLQTIGRVRDNRVNRIGLPLGHPGQAITLDQLVPWCTSVVNGSFFTHHLRSIQATARPQLLRASADVLPSPSGYGTDQCRRSDSLMTAQYPQAVGPCGS